MTSDAFAAVLAHLKADEGFRKFPYRDTAGCLSVGYGTNLDAGLTEDQGTALLTVTVTDRLDELTDTLPWTATLDDVRLGVLAQLAFNLGLTGLLRFRMALAYTQAGDYAAAATALRHSAWADQVGARAVRLAQQMETGV